ncbi:hypothetical protein ACWGXJ_25745 [Paenibacillus sp. S33]
MGAKNRVIAGDYNGKLITQTFGTISLSTGFLSSINLDKNTIEEYEVMDESHRKSAASAIGRGLVGSFLLGPVGLLAGLSASERGVHTLAVQFKDGKKSLMEVDEKIYKTLMKKCF